MPASVQDLLLAAQSKQNSPFGALAKGLGSGFADSFNPDNAKKLLDMQQEIAANKRAAEMDAMLKKKLFGATEAQTKNDFNDVQPSTTSPEGASRMDQLLNMGPYSRDNGKGDNGGMSLPGRPGFEDLTPPMSRGTSAAAKILAAGGKPDLNGQSSVSSGRPVNPFTVGDTVMSIGNKGGYLTPEFKQLEPKPKDFTQFEYQDPKTGQTKYGNYDPNKGLRYMSPDDPLAPKKPADAMQGVREDNEMLRLGSQIIKDNDPYNASSRSVVGVLGRTNTNAQRALDLINDKSSPMTNERAQAIIHDIGQVVAGGAVTAQGADRMTYNTLQNKLGGLEQYLTGNPTDSVPPKVLEQMKKDITTMIGSNAQQIKNALDAADKGHSKILHHPVNAQQWSDFRKIWENPNLPADPNAPAPMQPGELRKAQTSSGKAFTIKAIGS